MDINQKNTSIIMINVLGVGGWDIRCTLALEYNMVTLGGLYVLVPVK
jgi:hypothetical protein